MPMFDRRANGFFKSDRALGMPAIHAITPADSFRIFDKRRTMIPVGKCLLAKIPGAVKVVLGAGSVDGWQRVPIDEEHVIALAKPGILVLQHGLRHTHKMPAPRRLHVDVVAFAIEIFAAVHRVIALLIPVVDFALARRSLCVLRMKATKVGGQPRQHHIVDGKEVRIRFLAAFIGNRNPGRTRKRHLKISVHSLGRRDCRQLRLINKIFPKA